MMSRSVVLVIVAALLLSLAACRRGPSGDSRSSGAEPPVRAPEQQAYALMDELTLGPPPTSLPAGFEQPQITRVSVGESDRAAGVLAAAVVQFARPGSNDNVVYYALASPDAAARRFEAMSLPASARETGRYVPDGFAHPAACQTISVVTTVGPSRGYTRCRVRVGAIEIFAQNEDPESGERGHDADALALAHAAVAHLEAVQAALAERARVPPGTRVIKIGWLLGRTYAFNPQVFRTFFARLEELGYTRGRNLLVEYRFAEEDLSRLGRLTAELVREDVDVLIAEGPAASAARNSTGSVPILFHSLDDPVAEGLVMSLARPGRNVTGISNGLESADFYAKQLELLKRAVPSIATVGVLTRQAQGTRWQALSSAATVLGIQLVPLIARDPEDLDATLARVPDLGLDAVFDSDGFAGAAAGAKLNAFMVQQRLPFVTVSGTNFSLIAYFPDPGPQYRHLADYVDRIAKGANPAELPVVLPDQFVLIANLRTARQIGITLSPEILAQATRVIE
jgi:putative ABC transport system substrate-binding protein